MCERTLEGENEASISPNFKPSVDGNEFNNNNVIIIIMYRLYSATLLKDPAALYNKSDINIKSIE